MSTREQETNLQERVGRLEANMDWVRVGFEEIKQEIRGNRQEIRDLAARMDARFDVAESRFDAINSRFDGVNSRFDGVNSRFDGVNSRLDGVNSRLDSWLKWILGLMLTSWFTLMASIWLKR